MASGAPDFAKLVPGFDFLQGLVKNAGSVLPNIGQWVAPTLNPEELDKRIGELRTVQFWLEQNARMLGATIQALEVQRMTLSTLQTMNVQVADLREALSIRLPEEAPEDMAPAPAPAAARPAVSASWPMPPTEAPEPPEPPAARKRAGRANKPAGTPEPASGAPTAGAVDPMQWWGALTKQFTELAANAMKDVAADATRGLAAATQPAAADAGDGSRRGATPDAHDAAPGAAEAPPRRRGGAKPADAAERPASPARKRAPARSAARGPRGG